MSVNFVQKLENAIQEKKCSTKKKTVLMFALPFSEMKRGIGLRK
jgi:hypothetical protein